MAIAHWNKGDDWVITVLAPSNPKQIDSLAYERFSLYRPGMRVSEYIEATKSTSRPQYARQDLTWDSERGFIRIDPQLR